MHLHKVNSVIIQPKKGALLLLPFVFPFLPLFLSPGTSHGGRMLDSTSRAPPTYQLCDPVFSHEPIAVLIKLTCHDRHPESSQPRQKKSDKLLKNDAEAANLPSVAELRGLGIPS